jgi:hypothetical protein
MESIDDMSFFRLEEASRCYEMEEAEASQFQVETCFASTNPSLVTSTAKDKYDTVNLSGAILH